MRQLLESPITIWTFVRLFTRVHPATNILSLNYLVKLFIKSYLMCWTNWWLLEKDLRHCWHWWGFTSGRPPIPSRPSCMAVFVIKYWTRNKLVCDNSQFIETTSVCCIIGPCTLTRLFHGKKWSGGLCALLLHFPSDRHNYFRRGVEHIPKCYQSCCKSASHDIIIRFWISINCEHDMDTRIQVSDTCLVLF